jgi:stage II sporulation protein AA (anti-sigma F factor antagonist)
LDITISIKKNVLVVSLSGELDHHTAKKVKDITEEAIKNKSVTNLVFDFTNLTFMDSSGIGVVVGRYKLIDSLGGRVAIVNSSSAIDRLFTMSGIKKIIAVRPTLSGAINYLQEEIS